MSQEDAANVLFELLHDELITYVYNHDAEMKVSWFKKYSDPKIKQINKPQYLQFL